MAKVVTIYHSQWGHTKHQAEGVRMGVGEVPGVEAELMSVEDATARMDELDSAAGIIFGCPTYMGSMSAGMKAFVEASSKKWFVGAWKNKVAGAFTNSRSLHGDKMNTLIGLFVNAMQHGMIYVSLGMFPGENDKARWGTQEGPGPESLNRVGSFIGPMAASFDLHPPEAPAKGDLETARIYGKRVAEIALKMAKA